MAFSVFIKELIDLPVSTYESASTAHFSGGRDLPLAGEAAKDVYRGTASCMGGYLSVAETAGAEIVIPMVAGAPPSRTTRTRTLPARLSTRLRQAVTRSCWTCMVRW